MLNKLSQLNNNANAFTNPNRSCSRLPNTSPAINSKLTPVFRDVCLSVAQRNRASQTQELAYETRSTAACRKQIMGLANF